MPQFAITKTCKEFGQDFTVGQVDPPVLSYAQRWAMAVSGLGKFFGGNPIPPAFAAGEAVPVTSVQLANPSAYGIAKGDGRTYETGQAQRVVQGAASPDGNLAATYDGAGRLTSLARAGGRRVLVTYPSSTQMVVTEQDVPTPAILTCATDTAGRVLSVTPNW